MARPGRTVAQFLRGLRGESVSLSERELLDEGVVRLESLLALEREKRLRRGLLDGMGPIPLSSVSISEMLTTAAGRRPLFASATKARCWCSTAIFAMM